MPKFRFWDSFETHLRQTNRNRESVEAHAESRIVPVVFTVTARSSRCSMAKPPTSTASPQHLRFVEMSGLVSRALKRLDNRIEELVAPVVGRRDQGVA
jgi:hypothetical protein